MISGRHHGEGHERGTREDPTADPREGPDIYGSVYGPVYGSVYGPVYGSVSDASLLSLLIEGWQDRDSLGILILYLDPSERRKGGREEEVYLWPEEEAILKHPERGRTDTYGRTELCLRSVLCELEDGRYVSYTRSSVISHQGAVTGGGRP